MVYYRFLQALLVFAAPRSVLRQFQGVSAKTVLRWPVSERGAVKLALQTADISVAADDTRCHTGDLCAPSK